jgi:hypothetical protein
MIFNSPLPEVEPRVDPFCPTALHGFEHIDNGCICLRSWLAARAEAVDKAWLNEPDMPWE